MLGIKAGAISKSRNSWGKDRKFHIQIQANNSKQPLKHIIDLELQEGTWFQIPSVDE